MIQSKHLIPLSIAIITAIILLTCSRRNELFTNPNSLSHGITAFCGVDTLGFPSAMAPDSLKLLLVKKAVLFAGQPATFVGIVNGDSSLVSWHWDFGDGSTSGNRFSEHAYDSSKTFIARFIIEDKTGMSLADSVQITVNKVASGGAIKGYAFFQGKTNHQGIKVSFIPLKPSPTSVNPFFTGQSGLYEVVSNFPPNTYTIKFTDTLGYFSPAEIDSVVINNGMMTVLPNVVLKDNHPPHIFSCLPANTISIRQPVISAVFNDTGSGISPTTFKLMVNNDTIRNNLLTLDTSGFSWTPKNRLPDGKYTIQTAVSDSAGNPVNVQWNFTVDAMKLTILTPDTTVRIHDTLKLRSLVSNVYSKITLYKWDFDGNGTWDDSLATTDTIVSRLHVYTHDTVYSAIEYVRDDSGMVKLDTVTINVGSLPPVISSIRPDTTISIKDSILFFGAAHSPNGTIKEYAWDFNGDGTFEYTSATQIQAGYRYNTAGVYNAILRVTDDDNKKSYDTVRITVLQDAPVVTASTPDTLVSIKDTIHLHASATVHSGTIVKWEWDFGNTGKFVATSKGDTAVIAPGTATQAYVCVVRASDSKGNMSTGTVTTKVLQDVPIVTFFSSDTIIDHGGSIRCSVNVSQQFGTMTVEIDTANSGVFKGIGSLGLSGGKSYSFPTGNACFWDSVKVRITDDDGNVVIRGFKVDIRPQPLTITSIDSTVNTITVHYSQTQETDFMQYRIYRNTTSTVDTTSELWATITTAGTVSYTTPVPSYAWNPMYYRVYQKDNEGLWSAGSNVAYGCTVNSPPSTPVIVYPVNNGDTLWMEEKFCWNPCIDPNGNGVRYKVLINYDNAGYSQLATGIIDTFIQLTGYDSLSTKIKVIAYDTLGDSSAWSTEKTAFIGRSVMDIDGNEYQTIKIGTQIWMVENLKTTRYNDGTAIPLVTDSATWGALTTPGYCWYNNDSVSNAKSYGALYNWYTVNSGKLAPAGWHVPSDSEWTVLSTYLGGDNVSGGKLKEAGTTHWNSPNTGATNETGFLALPGGFRYYSGTYSNQSIYGTWWSATEYEASYAWYRYLSNIDNGLRRSGDNKSSGYSVRLLRN
jgi:uncharacterized protein (TIGR02145 family)